LDGLVVGSAGSETLISVANAGTPVELTGLDGDMAALRFTIRRGGLDLA
jgi:hypothetical protein